jgi:hypothetical protein
MVTQQVDSPWLLFMFGLPAKRASQRVDVWRRLKRAGALPLRSSGYILPNTEANEERLQWLARQVRKHKGQATVVHAQAFDGRPSSELARKFSDARSKEYEVLMKELLQGGKKPALSRSRLARLRRRFQEIVDRDFFSCPLRTRIDGILAKIDQGDQPPEPRSGHKRKEYSGRTWVTRHRPGIDRVASAWLVRRFLDPGAIFAFADDPKEQPAAIPFDMFSEQGFGHRGEDCTFETLMKDFAVGDGRVKAISEAVHDADLGDEKFGRTEAAGLDRVLRGWARQGISDDELLRRGMEMIEGLYQSLDETA